MAGPHSGGYAAMGAFIVNESHPIRTDFRVSTKAKFADPIQDFRLACYGVLLVCCVLYVVWTWHWPLVGDASLIHYICFLMDHGMAPYRDVSDMNLPGSYLVEWGVMHLIGGGALAWRLFDLAALLVIGASMMVVTGRDDRLAGVFSAVVFAMVHGRDGINDTGQRDLTMAALVIVAYVLLFRTMRRESNWVTFLFGFCMGAAGTIKPSALPLAVLLLGALAAIRRQRGRRAGKTLVWGSLGLLLPLVISLVFLVREHALGAFVHGLWTVVPYYASLGGRPWDYLLMHSVAPLMPLVILWVILGAGSLLVHRGWPSWAQPWSDETWERAALLLGAAIMLAGYMAQRKGLPYHRYPLLVLLLPLIGMDLTRALRQRGFQLGLGIAGIGFGTFFLVPQSIVLVHRYDWRHPEFISMLQQDLIRLGGSDLSGRVQCVDSVAGCNKTLYRMRLVTTSGVLSDFLLFGPEQNPTIREARAKFLPTLQATPPEVIVVSSRLFPGGPDHFRKLDRWPAFREFLAAQYQLCIERTPPDKVRWWSRTEQPPSYRIYVLKSLPGARENSVCNIPQPASDNAGSIDALQTGGRAAAEVRSDFRYGR